MTDHHDEHMEELLIQCASATPLSRLALVEQYVVLNWLIDGGHMTRTGKPLQRARPAPHPTGSNPADGSPIFAPDADFTKTETVVMKQVS